MPREFSDPYTYPSISVLRNIPGLRAESALRCLEHEHAALRIEELCENPISGWIDLVHLKAIHAHVFQDVCEWAGEVRRTNISKEASRFAQPAFIEGEAKRFNGELAAEGNLRSMDKLAFVDCLAHYYAEWSALHPFLEGSGRATRELIGKLARGAGFDFDQTRIDNSKDQ